MTKTIAVPVEPEEIKWLREFINCAVFSPPPSEIQRAQNVLTKILAAPTMPVAETRDEIIEEIAREVETHNWFDNKYCAAQIRALKKSPEGKI